MRISSFNVENLFARAKVLSRDVPESAQLLANFAELNALLIELEYTPARKTRILELLEALGIRRSDEGVYVRLRQNRGRLVSRSRGVATIKANGRADWSGWVELKSEPANELAFRHTARVIRTVDADIMGVVEADNRTALKDFGMVIRAVGGQPFRDVMVIDGNDDRGIDVGLMTKPGFELTQMRSHVEDRDDDGVVFSRDCPEYVIDAPGGQLVVLLNHLKSKGFSRPGESSDERRRRQAVRVAAIYERLRAEGETRIAILGDLNDFPGSAPLEPLLDGIDARDVSTHPAFDDGGFPGTFGRQSAKQKIDYILLSPALFDKVEAGGVCRLGVWGENKSPPRWDIFDTLTQPVEAASDHAAIFVDLAA